MSGDSNDLTESAIDLGDFKLIVNHLDGADPKSLPDVFDRLKNKLGSSIVVLSAVNEGKVSLIAGVTKDLTERFNAGDLVNHVASDWRQGGGRPIWPVQAVRIQRHYGGTGKRRELCP